MFSGGISGDLMGMGKTLLIILTHSCEALGSIRGTLIHRFSLFFFFLSLYSLSTPLSMTRMARSSSLSLSGPLGSWMGGSAAHLIALVLAPYREGDEGVLCYGLGLCFVLAQNAWCSGF